MPLIWEQSWERLLVPQFRCLCFSLGMKGFIFSVYDQTRGALSHSHEVEEEVLN